MDYIRLGSSGLKVSRIALGCMTYGTPDWRPWVLTEDAARPLIRQAIEAGITFFDTADMYSFGVSEEILGRTLKEFMPSRDQAVIATKVFFPTGDDPNARGLSRKHLFASIDASLRRLGIDHVDLYQIHRFDEQTPIEETLSALDEIVRAGKARYLGASTMPSWRFMKLLSHQRANNLEPFVSMQNQYNLVYREEEREMLPLCQAEGIGVIPWSPLARGLLAGTRALRTQRATTDDQMRSWYKDDMDGPIVDAVQSVAARHGRPAAQIALAWLMSRPAVTAPIVGVSKPHHLDHAVAATTIKLGEDDLQKLEQLYAPHEPLEV